MKRARIGIVLLVCVILVSCATINATFGTKPWAQRTPSEKSLAMLETYNSVYRNTLAQANTKNLSEPEKQIVRTKKDVLKQVNPLIGIYDGIVLGGGTPTKNQEDAILALFDKIGAKLAGR